MQDLLSVIQEASVLPKKKRVGYYYPRGTNKHGIGPFRRGAAYSRFNTGLRNKNTRTTILEPNYEIGTNGAKTFFIVGRPKRKSGSKKAIFSGNGKRLTGFMYSSASIVNSYFVKARRKGSTRILDSKGKEVLSDVKWITTVYPNLLRVEDDSGKVTLYNDRTLKPSGHTAWDEVDTMFFRGKYQHIIKVSLGQKEGVYDKRKKKLIIPVIYDGIDSVEMGTGKDAEEYIEAKDTKTTVFDLEGNVLVSPKYDGFDWWEMEKDEATGNWLVLIENKNKYGLYDFTARKEVLPAVYDQISIYATNWRVPKSYPRRLHRKYPDTFFVVSKERSFGGNSLEGIIAFRGGKLKQILPVAFRDIGVDNDGFDVSFKFGEDSYTFDFEGRPKGTEGGHKLIKDIFKYVSKSI